MLQSQSTRFETMIIFALDDDRKHKMTMWQALKQAGCTPKQLCGCYKGVEEVSYLVPAKFFPLISELCEGQESILRLSPQEHRRDGLRKATLLYQGPGEDLNDPDPAAVEVNLGYFRPTSREYALKQDAWTLDVSNNQFYVCE